MNKIALAAIVMTLAAAPAAVQADQNILPSHLQSIRVNSTAAAREVAFSMQGIPGSQEMSQSLFAMGQLANQMLIQPMPPQMLSRQVAQLQILQNQVALNFQLMQQGAVRPGYTNFHGHNGYEYCPNPQSVSPLQLRRLGTLLQTLEEDVECLNEHYGFQGHGHRDFDDRGFDNRRDFNRRPGFNNRRDFDDRRDFDRGPDFNRRDPGFGNLDPGFNPGNPNLPGLNDRNPGFNPGNPNFNQPNPGFPNLNQPNPGFNPGLDNRNPGFNQPNPGFNQGLDNRNPGFNQPNRGFNQENPNFNQPQLFPNRP